MCLRSLSFFQQFPALHLIRVKVRTYRSGEELAPKMQETGILRNEEPEIRIILRR